MFSSSDARDLQTSYLSLLNDASIYVTELNKADVKIHHRLYIWTPR